MKNILSNFIYQAIYQITKIIIPVITIPIVSRALGPEGVGIYNYTYSITQYFILFAGLGISLYGSREIAMAKDDNRQLSETFWEIFSLKGAVSIVALVFFLLFAYFTEDSVFFYLQIFSVLAIFFDISWFFMGIEDFKKTSLINLVSQLIVFLLIIFSIKTRSDVYKYILIQSIGKIIPQLMTWMFVKNYISLYRVSIKKSLSRTKEAFKFFIPQISITLYTNLNKTLLGIFVGSIAVGYYSNSLTLNNVFITLITTLDIVMLPRMSKLFSENNENGILKNLKVTVNLQLFFSIAIMFGMLTVYDKLVPWFLGEEFIFVENIIPIFSVLIVIVPLGMAISRQYLLPIGNTKEYNKSVIIGAVLSVILNSILLPTIGIFGAIISNILSELFVLISRIIPLYKKTTFRLDLKTIGKYLLSGLIMTLLTRTATGEMAASIGTNLVQATIGIFTYFTLTILFKANPLWTFTKNYIVSKSFSN